MKPSKPSATYFIVVGNEHAGPFTIEQLVAKKITENSLVWTAGMDNWVAASSVPALKPIFKNPQKVFAANNVAQAESTKKDIHNSGFEQPITFQFSENPSKNNIKSLTPNNFFVSLKETILDKRWRKITYSFITLFVIIAMLQIGKMIRKSNLEERNRLTEERNMQVEKEQNALLLKEAKQREHELKDQQRREIEIKESIKRRITEIEVEITMQKEELVLARQKFSEATAPQLFRSPEKRNEDVNAAMDLIKYHEEEIDRLQKEIKIVELNGKRAIEGRNY